MSRLSIQSWLNWLGVEVGVEEEADMGVRHFFANCCSDQFICGRYIEMYIDLNHSQGCHQYR